MRTRLTPRLIVRLSFAFVVAALLIPAVPDVDLWGHTLFGGDIVHSRAIPAADSYAFTSDLPWVNHEWLSEVCMYAAYALGGGSGLVALRLVLLGTLLWTSWRTLRREGVSGESALVIAMVLALVTYPRTQHVRPQLFSLTMFAVLLSTLMDFDRTRAVIRLISIPLLMLLWANLHGGFIVGFVPVGIWAVLYALDQDAPVEMRLAPAIALVAAVVATLINPYGVGLWKFLWRTVSMNRRDIDEWWSILSAERALLVLWSTTALIAIAGVRWHGRPLRWPRTGLVAVLALASFRVNRLDAFFAIATIMLFGQPLSRFLTRRERTSPRKELSRAFRQPMEDVLGSIGVISEFGVRWLQRKVGPMARLRGVHPAFPHQPLEGTAHFHLRERRRIHHVMDRAGHHPAHPDRACFGHIALDQGTRIDIGGGH